MDDPPEGRTIVIAFCGAASAQRHGPAMVLQLVFVTTRDSFDHRSIPFGTRLDRHVGRLMLYARGPSKFKPVMQQCRSVGAMSFTKVSRGQATPRRSPQTTPSPAPMAKISSEFGRLGAKARTQMRAQPPRRRLCGQIHTRSRRAEAPARAQPPRRCPQGPFRALGIRATIGPRAGARP